MQTLIFLSLIIHSAAAHSPVKIMEDANQKINQGNLYSYPQVPCSNCSGIHVPDTIPASQQCLAQICPAYYPSDEMVTSPVQLNAGKDREFMKVLGKLNRMFEVEVREVKDTAEFALKSLSEGMEVRERALIVNYKTIESYPYVSSLAYDPISLEIDVQASRNAIIAKGASPEIAERTIEIMKNQTENLKKDALWKLEYDELVASSDPEKLKSELTRRLESFREQGKKTAKVLELDENLVVKPSFVEESKRLIAAGEFPEVRFNAMRSRHFALKFLPEAVDAKPGTPLGDVYAVKPISLKKIYPENAEPNLRMIAEAADKFLKKDPNFYKNPYGNRIAEAIGTCNEALREAYVTSPDENQLEAFRKEEKKLLKEYLNGTRKFLSHHSADGLDTAAKKWKFKEPLTRSQVLKAFDERISAQIDYPKLKESLQKMGEKQKALAAASVGASAYLRDPTDFMEDLIDTCKEKVPKAYEDLAYGHKDQYLLSARTAIRPEFAKYVAFHEYSHLASKYFESGKGVSDETKKWFRDLRKCLNDQHGEEEKFEEEDFAATMSFAVAPDAPYSNCTYNIQNNLQSMFTLKAVPYDKRHSSPLYHLVQSAVISGRGVPESCRKALAEKGETNIPKNCYAITPPASASRNTKANLKD